jgi:hypothetical protein
MICLFWPALKPELTWDGLLTFITGILAFVAGLLAFLGIRSQIQHADAGLQRQLDAEKEARETEVSNQRRAIFTALLFEMDSFYRVYVRQLSQSLGSWGGNGPPPLIKPVGTEWLAVYREGASQIGNLPQETIKPITTWYGHAQSLIGTLEVYSQRYNAGSVNLARCFGMLEEIKGELLGMAEITFFTCGLLCKHAGVEFIAPMISVADDSTVSDEVRTALKNALKGYETVVPWESPVSGTSAAERK